jgi:hypothetical protein
VVNTLSQRAGGDIQIPKRPAPAKRLSSTGLYLKGRQGSRRAVPFAGPPDTTFFISRIVNPEDYSGQTPKTEKLKSRDKVKFSRLFETRKLYSQLFSEKDGCPDVAEIDKVLSDRRLDELSAVRNLLVHKAGKADETYIANSKNNSVAPKLELDHDIKLDGPMVTSLLRVVTELGPQLAKAADAWTQAANAQ